MTDNELLLAISNMMDKKIDPINERIKRMELLIENELKHDVNLLVENYIPTADRYEKASNQIEAMESDIDLLKMVVSEHSEKFLEIS